MKNSGPDLHMLNLVVDDMRASLDFYDVGLISPIDESRRTWPPEESPAS